MVRINFIKFLEKVLTKTLFFLIKIYQFFIARLLGGCNCRFEPTCSHYMLEAVEKKGLIKGIFLGVTRILRCHPFSKKSGYDPVK
ncbi:MAG: membrane protein insertion efficiency factor YidD [Proteobacteria bacterium]|nr:membrane protein insertion efficiency factor YidD [Pseudomonadota bacterium]